MRYLLPFPKPQVKATFLRRPQRFLAEMTLLNGINVMAYCPNPGSLHGCLVGGSQALLWDSGNAKRKRRYTWRAIRLHGVWIGTDTHFSNRIVEEVILQRIIPGIDCYETLQREVTIGGTKVDFLLTGCESRCIVEVKSSTIVQDRIARFPDSITVRGLRQLQELSTKASEGYQVVLVYIAQRSDVVGFTVTDEFYPEYANAFKSALASGVKVIALSVPVHARGICYPNILPIII